MLEPRPTLSLTTLRARPQRVAVTEVGFHRVPVDCNSLSVVAEGDPVIVMVLTLACGEGSRRSTRHTRCYKRGNR